MLRDLLYVGFGIYYYYTNLFFNNSNSHEIIRNKIAEYPQSFGMHRNPSRPKHAKLRVKLRADTISKDTNSCSNLSVSHPVLDATGSTYKCRLVCLRNADICMCFATCRMRYIYILGCVSKNIFSRPPDKIVRFHQVLSIVEDEAF